jgi:hypothetical protein
MSDTIGHITVPTVINSGPDIPLTTQYPFGFFVERPVIVHRFASLAVLAFDQPTPIVVMVEGAKWWRWHDSPG